MTKVITSQTLDMGRTDETRLCHAHADGDYEMQLGEAIQRSALDKAWTKVQ